jgi:hypothetical protein
MSRQRLILPTPVELKRRFKTLTHKTCPECAERVKHNALKCKHCGSSIRNSGAEFDIRAAFINETARSSGSERTPQVRLVQTQRSRLTRLDTGSGSAHGHEADRARPSNWIQDPNTIKNYEMGGLPRLQILVRLAGALEVAIGSWWEGKNKDYHCRSASLVIPLKSIQG